MTSKHSTPFKMVQANKHSLANRKLIFGAGVNDANYHVFSSVGGNTTMCPYYRTWKDMLVRCFSQKFKERYPTYTDCSVSDEWLTFSNFREWMKSQDWEGLQLDKDVMYPRNKIYSSETCVFVTGSVNSLLNNNASARGKYPQGVDFYKKTGRFRAKIKINGKHNHLGYFLTSEEASDVYREAKRLNILKIACCEKDIRVKQGLYRHSELLRHK